MKLNLKKAFQIQNQYGALIHTGLNIASQNGTKKIEKHLKSKSLDGAIDETIETSIADNYEFAVNDVITFVEHLVSEKSKLTAAINEAKIASGFDIDGNLSMNKTKQLVAERFKLLSSVRTTTTKSTGRDYCFDAEKKQNVYQYPVEVVTEANFDKNVVAAIYKRLMRECEEVSAKVDEIMITVEVDYDAPYTTDMSFEEAIAHYLNAVKK